MLAEQAVVHQQHTQGLQNRLQQGAWFVCKPQSAMAESADTLAAAFVSGRGFAILVWGLLDCAVGDSTVALDTAGAPVPNLPDGSGACGCATCAGPGQLCACTTPLSVRHVSA